MNVYVVGSGKLAKAILAADLSSELFEVVPWPLHVEQLNEKAIVVHAGSGRQLKECISFCSRSKSILVELSTGLETEHIEPSFPLILCPNTSLLILKAMMMLESSGHYFKDYKISITESHQSAKTTEPGTAFQFAASLNYPTDKIISVRDIEIQRKLAIPEEFLDRHAYHRITIEDETDQVVIETRALGHSTYVRGVQRIINVVAKGSWQNRTYTILDLVDNNEL